MYVESPSESVSLDALDALDALDEELPDTFVTSLFLPSAGQDYTVLVRSPLIEYTCKNFTFSRTLTRQEVFDLCEA